MQNPTCTNVRIRSTQDAHKIFYAVQQGLLRMVTRRLDADERLALTTGCVYAWEERGPHTEITGLGIERFTEGRRWSPSRVRDEFLFYYEKYSAIPDASSPAASLEKHPPRDWDPLVKQTYSVWVETDKGRRKWHLTAYFTQTTVDDLGTIDDITGMQELVPPPELFKSTRVGKGRGKTEDQPQQPSDSSSKPPTAVARTYAPFPSLHNRYPSLSASPPASESVIMYEPYENMEYSGYNTSGGPSQRYHSPIPHQHSSSPPQYSNNAPYIYPSVTPTDINYHSSAPSGVHAHAAGLISTTPSIPSGSTVASPYEVVHYEAPSTYSLATSVHRSQSPTSPTNAPLQPIYTDNSSAYVHRVHTSPAPTYAYQNSSSTYIVPEHQERPLPPLHPTIPNYADREASVTSPFNGPQPAPLVQSASMNTTPSYELLSARDSRIPEARRGSTGPDRDLAPIYSLTRPHPYRRDPLDDRTLRLLTPRSS